MKYIPLQEHSHGMHHASSRGHPLASGFLVYVPQFYVPLDKLFASVYKKSTRSDTTQPVLSKSGENFSDFPAMPSLSQDMIRSASNKIFSHRVGWGRWLQVIICEGIFERKKNLPEQF